MDTLTQPTKMDRSSEPPLQISPEHPLYTYLLQEELKYNQAKQKEAEEKAERFPVQGKYRDYRGFPTTKIEELIGQVGEILAFYNPDGSLDKLLFKPKINPDLNPDYREGEAQLILQGTQDPDTGETPHYIIVPDRYIKCVEVLIGNKVLRVTVAFRQQGKYGEQTTQLYHALRQAEQALADTTTKSPRLSDISAPPEIQDDKDSADRYHRNPASSILRSSSSQSAKLL